AVPMNRNSQAVRSRNQTEFETLRSISFSPTRFPQMDTAVVFPAWSKLNREWLQLDEQKVIGQLESVLRALNKDDSCFEVLQRLSAARGAINSLMAELMEDHIRNHMPRNSKSSEEAADGVIQIVRTYLK